MLSYIHQSNFNRTKWTRLRAKITKSLEPCRKKELRNDDTTKELDKQNSTAEFISQ